MIWRCVTVAGALAPRLSIYLSVCVRLGWCFPTFTVKRNNDDALPPKEGRKVCEEYVLNSVSGELWKRGTVFGERDRREKECEEAEADAESHS